MNVAVLLMPEVLELNDHLTAGTERAMLSDLAIFRKNNIDYQVFSSSKVNKQTAVRNKIHFLFYPKFLNKALLQTYPHFFERHLKRFLSFWQVFFIFIYVLQFVIYARNKNIWYVFSVPMVSIFNPRKTVNMFDSEFPLPFFNTFKKRYLNSHYLFVSEYLRKRVINNHPGIAKKSSIIRCGIDTNLFSFVNRTKHNRHPMFAYVGAWLEMKGVFTFLELLRNLHIDGCQFSALLIGSADLWRVGFSTSYLNQIVHKVKMLGKNVPELKVLGAINYDLLPDIYSSIDYLVSPATWGDPSPLTCLEAMSCGASVLGFKNGGIPEEVIEGKTGYLAQTGKKDELYTLMKKACQGNLPKLNPSMIRSHVVDHFSLHERENHILNYLRKLLTL